MTPREQIEALAKDLERIVAYRKEHAHSLAWAEHGRADSEKWCAERLRAVLASWTPPDEKTMVSPGASSASVPAPEEGKPAGCDESVRAAATLSRPRTVEEAFVALGRICAGEVRRCIPARIDDDDVVLGDVIHEWKRLRSRVEATPAPTPEAKEEQRKQAEWAVNDLAAIGRELDRLGAATTQPSGFGYSPLGRLRVLTRDLIGQHASETWHAAESRAEAAMAALRRIRDSREGPFHATTGEGHARCVEIAARALAGAEGAAPCGGSRCYRADGAWIHSSKSYDSCGVNRTAGD
jgi:hypothetical protein